MMDVIKFRDKAEPACDGESGWPSPVEACGIPHDAGQAAEGLKSNVDCR